jgi:DNA adenine methylase
MARYNTPLRYPGGKQRLAPFVAELLEVNGALGWNYAEPYAGGAGVAIELLLRNKVRHIYLNDSSLPIYAFWKAVLSDPDSFCRRISRASLTLQAWRMHREVLRHPREHDLMDLGFSTFFLNRCSRSGVLTAGVIGGLEQRGEWRIDARFPRNELIKRIENIALNRRRITVTNLDAETFMVSRLNRLGPQTLVYCDPPYFARAKRLYLDTYQPADHFRLAQVIQSKLRHPWLVSYDKHPLILSHYRRRRWLCYSLQYSAIKAYTGTEIFVFSDSLVVPGTSALSWLAKPLSALHRTA